MYQVICVKYLNITQNQCCIITDSDNIGSSGHGNVLFRGQFRVSN